MPHNSYSKPVEDYAMIGDGQTAALVAKDGSIDWLCWPRFDSDACFAALLGDDNHGNWRIAPDGPFQVTRRYHPDTLILETTFTTETGSARLTDFMPMRPDGTSAIVRLVEGVQGSVDFGFFIRIRFNYGDMRPWIQPEDDHIAGVIGPDRTVLRSDVKVESSQQAGRGRFTVQAGQRLGFTLQYGASNKELPQALDRETALAETDAFWREWIGRFDKPTKWPDAVKRSLITLKALIHRPTGGLVAAPTLGLPEIPGGDMNWDYRYCWLRDSTFTVTALLNAGYQQEAQEWMVWLMRAIAGMPEKMQIMYRVDGARHLEEWEAGWLPGYGGARPVRVGNRAAQQLQLDVYGEVLDSAHLAEKAGIERSAHGIEVEALLVEHVVKVWQQPDQGIWESRDTPRHYVVSKAMCWVALDRFLRCAVARAQVSKDRAAELAALRDRIHQDVLEHGFNKRLGHFTQYYGSHNLDASLLLLPLIGFIPADDPRMAGTIAAIERDLMQNGLVRRYAEPMLGREEGAFLACTCWLADCKLLQDRKDDAEAIFERLLSLANDVGLLAEEYHVPSGRMTGNFPQALSHLAVINTALALCGPVLQRGG